MFETTTEVINIIAEFVSIIVEFIEEAEEIMSLDIFDDIIINSPFDFFEGEFSLKLLTYLLISCFQKFGRDFEITT